MEYEMISITQLNNLLNKWIADELEQGDNFIAKENDTYIAIDNFSGGFLMEEFSTLAEAIKYLEEGLK